MLEHQRATSNITKNQSPMATYMGQEGGDEFNNKVEPFPGYRDPDVVA